MKIIQKFVLVCIAALMAYSATLRAEDIDIYVDNSTTVGAPNVLFVLDNGANFSADANGAGCQTYRGTTEAPSLGTSKASGILQCALVDAINSLPDNGTVNIGLMVSNANNFGETRATNDPTKGGYHDLCANGGTGGCLIRSLQNMTATNKASLVAFIKGWDSSSQSTADKFNIKVNSSLQASAMQESWAYFNGKTGLSGMTYSPSILGTGCQKNFIIYVSNTEKDPSSSEGIAGLTAAQVGATSAQTAGITGSVKFSPAVCGSTTSYTLATGNNYADEWARLLYQQDGGEVNNEAVQNVYTYTVGILGPTNKCSVDTLGMLSSMAAEGHGRNYTTASVSDLTDAFKSILNEVQAVNSVFSSASLPVSVNAEGSYLNQIYLGMFRPDPSGAPRWMGNLKQYQLIVNGNTTVLGDNAKDANGNASPKPAINATGTGFISPNAVSFWTYKDVNTVPDSGGGFWVKDKKGTPESGYDSADGEVVEKGGAAQQIRKENLTTTFAGSRGTSNPRRLFTYCPAGTACAPSLVDDTNAFTTLNAGIAANAFGTSTTVKVASIVRTGTTAVVTTNGNHGFSDGTTVTISNAGQPEYNVTQAITYLSATTFRISNLPDYPTTPSAGTYTVSPVSAAAYPITSVTRTSTGAAKEKVTVVTSSAHGFTTSSVVQISGVSPSNYNLSVTPTAVATSSFTFDLSVNPTATSVNGYTAVLSPGAYPSIANAALSNPATGQMDVTTPSPHKLHQGQTFIISNSTNKYVGTYTVSTVVSSTKFSVTGLGNSFKNNTATTGTVAPDTSTTQGIAAGKITRGADTNGVATATIASGTLPTDWFGHAVGDTKTVNIVKSSGTSGNESAYEQSNATLTCLNAGCTSASFSVTVVPSSTITLNNAQVGAMTGSTVSLAAGAITRTTAGIATATGVTANNFTNGQSVNIAASGTPQANESAYVGTWTISCTAPCTSFTFGPVTLTPTSPATGSNIQAYSGSTPPDRDTVIKWLRGADNYGDEHGPGGTVTVRPSIHGDVLHSRPLVINYGDTSRGIVVYYGANDGIFRAVNGNQEAAIGSVPAGGEIWGLVLPEHYSYINRLRLNSPELLFPSTSLTTAQAKDYFTDGPTGAYQKLNANGTINTAYIYLTMRRGGRFMYGLNVTTPSAPSVLWTISNATPGFEELGQTWSRPKATLVQGGGQGSTPVLVFGAGYDPTQDSEPPSGMDSQGRGIFVVNAVTGALIWSASPTCTTSATCRNVPGMLYSIPSDIATVDRDNNGYADKLYFGDMGGNVWRADISDANTANWTVTKIASVGCDDGTAPSPKCGTSSTSPASRKFFFPPSVLTVKSSGASGSYDLISLPSGDREHPLKSSAEGSSFKTTDRFFMVRDINTLVGTPASSTVVTLSGLTNITSTNTYNGTDSGFYRNFATGEKGVNAPLAVNGKIFFSTNKPIDRTKACAPNLGEARAYAINPFTGETESQALAGGGLPPSAVSGLVTVTKKKDDGTTYTEEEKFCIGCAVGCTGSTCNVALENTPPKVTIPKNLRRTYWYKK